MEKTEEEIQLIDNILNGETDRYKVLVDRYAPMVFSVVNDFVNSEEDAEELAQAIFVKTYERLSSFNGESKFSSWLYMIAKNHCRDYAKNIRRENKTFSDMPEHDLEQQMKDDQFIDKALEQKEWIDLLKKGLNVISEEYAEAFLMKYEDDMTYKAMSERLGATVSALKVRVYRAKKELKAFIEKHS
jgi:RNA polymerase sigma-70 factor (ECF subfamily)